MLDIYIYIYTHIYWRGIPNLLVLTNACESRIVSKGSVKKYLLLYITWPQALLRRERKLVSHETQWLGTFAGSPVSLVTEINRQHGMIKRMLGFKQTWVYILVFKFWANFLTLFCLSFLICRISCWRISCEYKKRKLLVPQLCLALCDPMDCSPPDFSVHEIL